MKKLLTILTIFCVMFTSIPMMSGSLESNALAKTITLKATATGTTSIKLTWNKVKTPYNGYAVFRDGKLVKRFGTKTTSFSDSGLAQATYYTYQIKTYKKTIRTQWYNKKTKKWTYKKPAKKDRGKSRKKTTYVYKLKSNEAMLRTKVVYYTITWKNWNGDTLDVETVRCGLVPEYTGTKPKRADDNDYSYTFKGWSPSVVAATGNATYTAQFKKTARAYTITWKNWDGTKLGTDSVKEGTVPTYSGATPTRPADDTYTYTFKGWSPSLSAATENRTYTAQYTKTTKPIGTTTYTITWKNWDGTILRTDTVNAGTTPSYNSTPTRPTDSNYTYTFAGWSPTIVTATKNATYTATYSSSKAISAPSGLAYSINSNGYPKLTWNAVSGATGYRLYRTYNGSTVTTTVTTTSVTDTSVTQGLIYEYYVVALNGSTTSPKSATISVPVDAKKTVTDFLGITRTFTKKAGKTYWTNEDAGVVSDFTRWDKTIDGTFTYRNDTMVQYHGATFDATKIANAKPDMYNFSVQMYNGDVNKFSIELENGVTIRSMDTFVETETHQIVPAVKYYYYKDAHPIARTYYDGSFVHSTTTSNNITTKEFFVYNGATDVGAALGIWAPIFKVYVKYDGKLIETINVDTASDEGHTSWTTQTCNGMSPWRKVALDMADAGIEAKGGSTGQLYQDLHLIRDYLEETYAYGQVVDAYGADFVMMCNNGALVLETYAVYRYEKFGFASSGSNKDGIHVAFNLNEDPDTYYEAMHK